MKKMNDVCKETGLSYETLKYYCNEGLVPNHQRDHHNHRIFSEDDIQWIKGLICLRQCGMSIADMKTYMHHCMVGIESIPQRKNMLEETRKDLEKRKQRIEESLDYIDAKQAFYDEILQGKRPYHSSLMKGSKQ